MIIQEVSPIFSEHLVLNTKYGFITETAFLVMRIVSHRFLYTFQLLQTLLMLLLVRVR